MKIKTKLIFFITTVAFIFLSSLSILMPQSENGPDTNRLFSCWLKSPYQYMFANSDEDYTGKTITLFGKKYGSFLAGPNGILYYGGLSPCAAEYLKNKKQYKYHEDIQPIEKLASMKAYKRKWKKGSFSFINPKIIKWGISFLLPDPSNRIDGRSYQEVYDIVFKRFARLMTESYLFIKNKRNHEEEQLLYLKAMLGNRSFDGIEYLDRRFKNNLSQYDSHMKGTAFQPSHAIGFWIRRGIDGTDRILWNGLAKGMVLYDNFWFNSVKAKFPKQ